MNPLAITELLDATEDIRLCLLACQVVFVMDQPGLELAEEALHGALFHQSPLRLMLTVMP